MEYFVIDSAANKVITTRHKSYEATMLARLYSKMYNVTVTIVHPLDVQIRLVHSDGTITECFANIKTHSNVSAAKNLHVQEMAEYMYDSGYDSESVKSVLGNMLIKTY